MLHPHYVNGWRAAAEALNAGKNAYSLLAQLASSDTSQIMLIGALSATITAFDQIYKKGMRPRVDPSQPDLASFMKHGPNGMAACLNQAVADKSPHLDEYLWGLAKFCEMQANKVAITSAPVDPNPTPPPAAPEPVNVRVTAMPERITETTVTYSKDGEIKSAAQIEKDVATA